MHSRNPYKTPPDFEALAKAYSPFENYVIRVGSNSRVTIDFEDDKSQRRLTEAIMYRDFGVKMTLPPDRLCPPVPNRMNYVLWIQDIVYAHSRVLNRPHTRAVKGVDIGTGASAIYPLLACSLEQTWEMVVTELDPESYAHALSNITSNPALKSRIRLLKASSDSPILFPLELESETGFDFTMCNPPFYTSQEEVEMLAKGKDAPPNAACTGAPVEMIFSPGGESAFVEQMIRESNRFRTKCRWYTSMLGKMSSVVEVIRMLKEHKITNYAITEFVQGQTRRWAVAWSFGDERLPDSIARIQGLPSSHALSPLLPPRNTLLHQFPSGGCIVDMARLKSVVEQVLDSVEALTWSATDTGNDILTVTPLMEATDSTSLMNDAAARSGVSVPSEMVLPPSAPSTSHRAPIPLSPRGLVSTTSEQSTFLIEASGDIWSRSSRRRRQRAQGTPAHLQELMELPNVNRRLVDTRKLGSFSNFNLRSAESTATSTSTPLFPALVCSIRCRLPLGDSQASFPDPSSTAVGEAAAHTTKPEAIGSLPDISIGSTIIPKLEFQWIYGNDRALFESFVGHVRRKTEVLLYEK